MKSYTDVEQSKILAGILTIKSADMYYHYITSVVKNYHEDVPSYIQLSNHFVYFDDDIPCWSLAALFNTLPIIEGFGEETPHLFKFGDKWMCKYIGDEDTGMWRVADNPVDACYEMVLKLHELNLL